MSTFQTGSWFCSLLIGTESRKINSNLQKSTVNQKPFLLAMSLYRYSSAINGRRNQVLELKRGLVKTLIKLANFGFLKLRFLSEQLMNLKWRSSRKTFCSSVSKKKKLGKIKTIFNIFELSNTFRSRDITVEIFS